jgi:hypothetical protein
MPIAVARQEYDLVAINPAESQRARRFAIGGRHDTPMRYFKTGKLGHAGATYDCKHVFRNPEILKSALA